MDIAINKDKPFGPFHLARFPLLFPFSFAAATLVFLGWTSYLLFIQPYSGVEWHYDSGLVVAVDPQGPAAGILQVGDQVIAIDGDRGPNASEVRGHRSGDRVLFTVRQEDALYQVWLRLIAPPFLVLFTRFLPILTSFPFWLLGVLVLSLARPNRLVNLFFVLCLVSTLMFGLGILSANGPIWSIWAFNILQWWIGPLAIHLHLSITELDRDPTWERIPLILYGLSFVLSCLDLVNLAGNRLNVQLAFLSILCDLWVGITILAAAAIMVFVSRHGPSQELRRKTRIIGLAAIVACLPFICLSLVPELLFKQAFVPYEFSFLSFPILPLGYSYAILYYKLIHVERYVNRSAAYVLVMLILGLLYSLIYQLSNMGVQSILVDLGVTLILVGLANPLFRLVKKWIDQFFYGGSFDESQAIKQVNQALMHAKGDRLSIANTLCQTLQKSMQLEYVHLLLSDGQLASIHFDPKNKPGPGPAFKPDQAAEIFTAIRAGIDRNLGPGTELNQVLPDSSQFRSLVIGRNPQLWLLLEGSARPQGLLILGQQVGGGDFDRHDLEVLEVAIRQAGAALEIEALLHEVRQRSGQIEQLHYQVIRGRDEERKRIARDLHDNIIQALVGLNYQLAGLRTQSGPDMANQISTLNNDLRNILGDLRRVCADLRPPALDVLGLVSTLQSRVTELQALAPFEVELRIELPLDFEIPDHIALCLYRFFQEAVLNIQKHAHASYILVVLEYDPATDEISLTIEDDGCGFSLPASLSLMVQGQHYGLIGLKEQVEAVGGQMTVETKPGRGCRLIACIPLKVESNLDLPVPAGDGYPLLEGA